MKHIRRFPFVSKLAFVMLAMVALVASQMTLISGVVSASEQLEKHPSEAIITPEDGDKRQEPEANLPYLFAVFILTWALMFGYVFYMSRRQRVLHQEIEMLKTALGDLEVPKGIPATVEEKEKP